MAMIDVDALDVLLKDKGITQTALAEALGFERSMISKWKKADLSKDGRRLYASEAVKIAEFLDVDVRLILSINTPELKDYIMSKPEQLEISDSLKSDLSGILQKALRDFTQAKRIYPSLNKLSEEEGAIWLARIFMQYLAKRLDGTEISKMSMGKEEIKTLLSVSA